ncbi:hypothetical protein VC83_03009 [Pseudogymnoascus destructans]|uniref:Uncharacterized protein n=1 Tax=Pseudogymnoascus destructans TaxID=655981 RepID=A0A177AFZ9_9PEZI|nr:uncharacterized protein VC83_03009 [Pseudogymnoascus destructans]OAF60181.1 hypothetical protein VC83_03009 [Pseudogymnoascus destructans]
MGARPPSCPEKQIYKAQGNTPKSGTEGGKKYDLKAKSTTQVKLKAEHLNIVSDAYLEFIQYPKVVHCTDADTHAKESGIRALESVIATIKASRGIATGKDGEEEEKPLRKFRLLASQSSSGGSKGQDE